MLYKRKTDFSYCYYLPLSIPNTLSSRDKLVENIYIYTKIIIKYIPILCLMKVEIKKNLIRKPQHFTFFFKTFSVSS